MTNPPAARQILHEVFGYPEFRGRQERIVNIGVKNTFEQVNGVQIPFEFAPRREGDVAISFADNSRALQELGWTPQYGLEDMLTDSWNWQKQNPNGYRQN